MPSQNILDSPAAVGTVSYQHYFFQWQEVEAWGKWSNTSNNKNILELILCYYYPY